MAKGPFSVWLDDGANLQALAALGLNFTPATQGGGTSIQSTATSYPASLVPRKTITVTDTGALPAFNGDLYVQVERATSSDAITLTLPASAKPGNRILIYRIPTAPPYGDPPDLAAVDIVPAAVGDVVNGFGLVAGQLSLQGRQHLIIIERTPSGWISMSSDDAGTTSRQTVDGDVDLEPWSGLKTFIVTADPAASIRLPASTDVPDGSRAIFHAAEIGGHHLVASGSDKVNGLDSIDIALERPLELVAVTAGWRAIGPTPTALLEQELTAAGQVQAVHGTDLLVRCNFAADGNVTLPALADCDVGATITFLRESGNGIPTIVPSAVGDEVNGTADVTYTPYFIRSLNDAVTYRRVDGGWIHDQGTEVGALISGATDPLQVPVRAQGTQYVQSTGAAGQEIHLAGLSLGRAGYRVVVFNSSAGAHVVRPVLGDLINGAATYAVAGGQVAIIEHAGSQWFALRA